MHAEHDELLRRVRETGTLSDEDEEALQKAVEQALGDFGPDLDEDGQPLDLEGAPAMPARESRDGEATEAGAQAVAQAATAGADEELAKSGQAGVGETAETAEEQAEERVQA
jgi:hypothetical protein